MYIFSWGGGGLEMYLGPPPRGFQKGGGKTAKKKCNQGPPTPFSTFFLAQKPPPPQKKKIEQKYVPLMPVHFFKKMYWRGPHPLQYIFLPGDEQRKCTQGRPTPLSTFFFCNIKMYSRASHPLQYIFLTESE